MTATLRLTLMLAVITLGLLQGGCVAVWTLQDHPQTVIHIKQPEHTPTRHTSQASLLLAGIAERDITPPIGIPKMGYSAWAREADGFRTRLKARAFYLKRDNSQLIVIVQADLPAASLVLRHAVAEAVANASDIPFAAISLHVTHTHSGPGQYFESNFYNTFGSNQPGFDPQVFRFLVTQLRDAVIEAWQNRKPARIATGEITLYGATRNRSIKAYVHNENVSDKRTDDYAALRAVNPRITLLRIDAQDSDGQWKPWGAFATFAIHGTGIPPFTHPYHGDVWAFMERDIEANIARRYQPSWKPVYGPFEANHGDNNPNYRRGMRGDSETRRIGKLVAHRTWQLFQQLDGQLQEDVILRRSMREIDLLAATPPGLPKLCERAIIGAATVGAAQGDEVFPISYLPPFAPGWPKRIFNDDCQAEKQWMLSGLQPRVLDAGDFPHRVNVVALQLHDLVLVALPFELTFEAGNRIRDAVAATLDTHPTRYRHLVVSSHANGYLGYATTHEEYQQQYYEGGHTLYGPDTTRYLAALSAKVAAEMTPAGFADLPVEWWFSLDTAHYFPSPHAASGQRRQIEAPVFVNNDMEREAYWSFAYVDVNPSRLALHEPLLQVQMRVGDGAWQPLLDSGQRVDDQGYDIQIRLLQDEDEGMARYQVRWYNPVIAEPGVEFRFAVAARDGQLEFYSSGFGGDN